MGELLCVLCLRDLLAMGITVGAHLAVCLLRVSKALLHAVLDCVVFFLATPAALAVGRGAGVRPWGLAQ